jgi:superfamily II DNA or RNA helicase
VRVIPVYVDSHIRVDGQLLPADAMGKILDALIVANIAKREAKQRNEYGWQDIPDEIFMVEMDGDEIIMSRGFAVQLKLMLLDYNIRVKWVYGWRWRRGTPFGKDEFSYRPHQPAAVDAMKKHLQGIYKAPTGSGKTVSALGLIWELHPRRSLILVDRINLVDQWVKRAVQHVGLDESKIGVIGSGEWSEGRITVATVQTLHRHRKRLQREGWFDKWDLVVLDECHHVTAETILYLIQQFRARVRIGMSATPDKTGIFELALNALGEVFYETTQEELRELGILVEPEVHVVPTEFTFDFWPAHQADKKGNCQKTVCKSKKPYHRHRDNYNDLKSALVTDEARNWMIGCMLHKHYEGNVQLVITDQTTHTDELRSLLAVEWPWMKVHILTGKQTRKQRDKIIEEIEMAGEDCVILSTIAGEALDIPLISRVHLVFPTSNPRKTEQNVGRGTRDHEDKYNTYVLDYVDWKMYVLAGQFRKRKQKCYIELGYTVYEPDFFTESKPRRKKGLMSLGGGS